MSQRVGLCLGQETTASSASMVVTPMSGSKVKRKVRGKINILQIQQILYISKCVSSPIVITDVVVR